MVASKSFPGLKAGKKHEDWLDLDLFLDAYDQKFKTQRKKGKKDYLPEDLAFATMGLQPSTVSQIYNCLYTIVINRTISGGIMNYPSGVSVLLTINPSVTQISGGFAPGLIGNAWNPRFVDLRNALSRPVAG